VPARSSGASSNALGFNPNLLSSIAAVTQHKKGRRRKAVRDPCGRPGTQKSGEAQKGKLCCVAEAERGEEGIS
jgi:hypothetical protein